LQIILASGSPRRRELLHQLGLDFVVIPSQYDEHSHPPLPPAPLAEHLALSKAREVAARYPDALVIGADTIVVLDGEVLGKPRDREEAVAMLRRLSGREHEVITGVAVLQGDRRRVEHEVTKVRFRPLDEGQIRRYVATGEPMDKAGAYGIQGRAAAMIESICGDYFNVVGLPLSRIAQMLSHFGVEVL